MNVALYAYEAMEDPIILHNTIQVLYVNMAAARLLRVHQADLTCTPLVDLVVAEFHALAEARMRVLRQNNLIDLPLVEYEFIRLDGTLFRAMVETRWVDDDLFRSRLLNVIEETI